MDTKRFRLRVRKELYENIIPFWIKHSRDLKNSGFFGRIRNDLFIEKQAPKSLVQTTRILWTFSALHQIDNHPDFLKMADWAYQFLTEKFVDKTYKGMYWLLDYQGNALDCKKKTYGHAFSLYSLAEYYSATHREDVLNLAINIFHLIEEKCHDYTNGGYFETANQNWSIPEDMRLSDVDMNEAKSMNAHLHLMEAYTTLYRVWPDELLRKKLTEIVEIFLCRIIDSRTNHFKLFFDAAWHSKTTIISFGHDIEGSWLLLEVAKLLRDQTMITRVQKAALNLVDITLKEGFSTNYAIYVEKRADDSIDKSTHWWQQAEAVVGLINAFQISEDPYYLNCALNAWQYIENYFVDKDYGEWFYTVTPYGKADNSQYKVSEWKGPYHNGRACMEIMKRLES